jgi:nicotinamide-nucleotide amidase
MPTAELLTLGTELLLGHIVNTNAAYLARELAAVGFNLYRTTTVGDNEARAAEAILEASARADVVIITGGLGPTADDVTREAVARATGLPLVRRPDLVAQIELMFTRRGLSMPDNNRRQADLPAGASAIENPAGTAPGFIVERAGRYIVALPGVPTEMSLLTETRVLPFLRAAFGLTGVIQSRTLRTCVHTEGDVDETLGEWMRTENPTVGLVAIPGLVDVRITARGDSPEAAVILIARAEADIRARLGDIVYGVDDDDLAAIVVHLLGERGLTLATAEVETGGSLWRQLQRVLDARAALKETIAFRRDGLLANLFGLTVPSSPNRRTLAESIAQRLRLITQADLGLAVVGEPPTQPGFGTEHPGDTDIILAFEDGQVARLLRIGAASDWDQAWVANTALDLVRRHLLNLPTPPERIT